MQQKLAELETSMLYRQEHRSMRCLERWLSLAHPVLVRRRTTVSLVVAVWLT